MIGLTNVFRRMLSMWTKISPQILDSVTLAASSLPSALSPDRLNGKPEA
jgi:hypothetical protein